MTNWSNHSLLQRANSFMNAVGDVSDQAGAEEALNAAFTGYTMVQSDPNATNWQRIMAAGGHIKVADRWERRGRHAAPNQQPFRPGTSPYGGNGGP